MRKNSIIFVNHIVCGVRCVHDILKQIVIKFFSYRKHFDHFFHNIRTQWNDKNKINPAVVECGWNSRGFQLSHGRVDDVHIFIAKLWKLWLGYINVILRFMFNYNLNSVFLFRLLCFNLMISKIIQVLNNINYFIYVYTIN